ncbi:PREDICTED: centromere protein H [Gekko japonicus]|uniref:Centromere protein H n=1 Tax=Gekko japonicus TaxID=146911 RepID=A0ABM1KG57_GEKJA|nr:PREDICTED: centromere protein H [Gekko japonicus]
MELLGGAGNTVVCLGEAAAPAPAAAFNGSSEEAAAEATPTRTLVSEDGTSPDLVTLLRIRKQIKQHLIEYNTAINANEESISDEVIDEKVVESSIEDLEREMEEVKVSYQNKTLALQRIQVTEALRTKLRNDDADSKLIWDTMKHIMLLSTAILKSQQNSRELEEKLNEVKQSRLALKRAGECKLAQIHETKRKQKDELENMEVGEILTKARQNLQQEIKMTTLIQNIFQSLITASGVNWAKDPDLKAIVLQLEKNVAGL